MKNLLKFLILPIKPLFELHWNKVFTALLQAIQLYCINFVIVLSFILIMPIIVEWDFVLESILNLIYTWFVEGVKFHILFFTCCLIFTILEDY